MITPRAAAHATALPPARLPAYVHDLDALDTHARAVRAALPPAVELYYATKANPAPELLAVLAPHVTGFEVASGGELAHVRRTVPGRPVAFGGPGKTEDELRLALALGAERLHVESPHELRLLTALARDHPAGPAGRPVDVLLRVNLPLTDGERGGAALTMGGRPGPFGLDPRDAEDCLRLLRAPLRLRGVHAHLASGLGAAAQLAVARRVTAWARDLAGRHALPGPLEVNLGGGMAVDYTRPQERFDWAAYGKGVADLAARHPGTVLRIEPGRSLTAYCGWYVTEVLDVKHSHGHAFAVLRGGTHHLRTPVAKGHDQPFTVLPVAGWERPWPRPAARDEPVTLCGQLCTPKDVLARDVPVAELRAGDRVAFALAGAYAWNISHHGFLMHPAPTFHFLPRAARTARTPRTA
ncbi:diaminopimelate decarboxylase [Streptomyces mashuensis]|uniref:Diaminopimelate decarboxylase n=1 Tax=Streptomyces mashuensis TaxID=33904 RepID=A0A919ED08_9ACTN|nr:type III PLP-dependent enzyme [Streptomyces mashuensis]GHF40752.1 diaminopimelate decarboxylase [Streptomyces mashuensis]